MRDVDGLRRGGLESSNCRSKEPRVPHPVFIFVSFHFLRSAKDKGRGYEGRRVGYLRVGNGVWVPRSGDVAANERSEPTFHERHTNSSFHSVHHFYIGVYTHRSNSYAKSLARVLGWKPLTKRIRAMVDEDGGDGDVAVR